MSAPGAWHEFEIAPRPPTARRVTMIRDTAHDAGITNAELEAEAHLWARDRGLIDYDVVICDELPRKPLRSIPGGAA